MLVDVLLQQPCASTAQDVVGAEADVVDLNAPLQLAVHDRLGRRLRALRSRLTGGAQSH